MKCYMKWYMEWYRIWYMIYDMINDMTWYGVMMNLHTSVKSICNFSIGENFYLCLHHIWLQHLRSVHRQCCAYLEYYKISHISSPISGNSKMNHCWKLFNMPYRMKVNTEFDLATCQFHGINYLQILIWISII